MRPRALFEQGIEHLREAPGVVWRVAAGLVAVVAVTSILTRVDGFVTPMPAFDFGDELEDGFRLAPLLGSALFAATAVLAAACGFKLERGSVWP